MTPPEAIDFQYGKAGKPYLCCGLEFNLTTSGDLALAAVRRQRPLGVDCELLRPRGDLIAVARRAFAPADAALVSRAPETERLAAFNLAWTALEASVKADGRGLFRSRKAPPLPDMDVIHFIPEDGFIAALAGAHLPPVSEWVTLSAPPGRALGP
jgi:4'-phosphopantetheinyl transferase